MITYFDRRRGTLERETVYGERWLRLGYQSAAAGWFASLAFRSVWPSRVLGWYFDSRWSRARIPAAVKTLAIDTSEFRDPVDAFSSFNAFFARHLKPDSRPPPTADNALASPADGRILVFPALAGGHCVPVKGRCWGIAELLGRPAPEYFDGAAAVIRLCPADYHRFHFPCDGIAGAFRDISGRYHSVNPVALALGINVFEKNRRCSCRLESSRFGAVAMVEVGAFGVGAIVNTYHPGRVVRMQEKGFFKFGGSSIVLCFEPGRVVFDADLVARSAEGIETLVRAGEQVGIDRGTPPAGQILSEIQHAAVRHRRLSH